MTLSALLTRMKNCPAAMGKPAAPETVFVTMTVFHTPDALAAAISQPPQEDVLYVMDSGTLARTPVQDWVQSLPAFMVWCRESFESLLQEYPRLPMVCVSGEETYAAFTHKLQTHWASLLKTEYKKRRLYEALVSSPELEHLVTVATAIFDNPITVSDASYRLIARSRTLTVDDPVWRDLTTEGYNTYPFVQKFNQEKIIEQILSSSLPVLIDKGIGKEIRRILGKIVVDEKVIAYLGVFESKTPLQEDALEIAEVVCRVLATRLSYRPELAGLSERLADNLLVDLLNGTITNEPVLQDRLHSSNWKPFPWFYAGVISLQESQIPRVKVEYVRAHLERWAPHVKVVRYQQYLVILLNLKTPADADFYWQAFSALLKEHGLAMGISFLFQHLEQLREHFDQAVYALRWLRRVSYEAPVVPFSACYTHFLLDDLMSRKPLNLLSYCHPGLMTLYEHDSRHGTAYYETIRAYFSHLFHLTNTAKHLHIHKNTMVHRMEKIRSLANMDNWEEEDHFRIHLTFQIVDYLSVLKDAVL